MSSGEAGLVAIINNGSRYSYYFPSPERIVWQKSAPDWRLLSVTVDVPVDATLVSSIRRVDSPRKRECLAG